MFSCYEIILISAAISSILTAYKVKGFFWLFGHPSGGALIHGWLCCLLGFTLGDNIPGISLTYPLYVFLITISFVRTDGMAAGWLEKINISNEEVMNFQKALNRSILEKMDLDNHIDSLNKALNRKEKDIFQYKETNYTQKCRLRDFEFTVRSLSNRIHTNQIELRKIQDLVDCVARDKEGKMDENTYLEISNILKKAYENN